MDFHISNGLLWTIGIGGVLFVFWVVIHVLAAILSASMPGRMKPPKQKWGA